MTVDHYFFRWASRLLAGSLLLIGCSPASPPAGADKSTAPAPFAVAVEYLDPPSAPGAMAPELAPGSDGALLTWLQPDGEGHTLYLAELRGQHWTQARQVTAGNAFFANWADRPAPIETRDGTLFVHWLEKLDDGTYDYGIELARSQDAGETWQKLGLLHDDASASEHGFVSYGVFPEGDLQAFWLDGRKMPSGGTMQLRTVRLGESAGEASTVLDERVCECCATDAAMTASGPVVVYRDRGPTEVRDIAIVRAVGEDWSEPSLIHEDGWQIHGCPVNGPAVAAAEDRVAVAWFTAAPHARVLVAFSEDGGASFGAPVVVDAAEPLGRVDVVFDSGGRGVVSWMGMIEDGAEIRWRTVSRNGEMDTVRVVAATTAARSAGVPRMLRRGDELLFAWIEDAEPPRLRAGIMALPG